MIGLGLLAVNPRVPAYLLFGFLAITSIRAGMTQLCAPGRVVLSPESIRIELNERAEQWNWAQLGWAEFCVTDLSAKKSLLIYDLGGRKVITLYPDFNNYADLTKEVFSCLQGQEVPARRLIQSRRARLNAVIYGVAAIFAISMGVWAFRTISMSNHPFMFFWMVLFHSFVALIFIQRCVLRVSGWDYMVDETTGKKVWRKVV